MRLWIVLVAAVICTKADELRRFPDDFILAAATAAYQIEGAWNADDKGENIWDHLTHATPWEVLDEGNGDIADDSYHMYKRDVEMMRELNLDAYRFSLSWSRILPSGFANKVSETGVAFYNNLINEMLQYNIQPMVTIYHWDLPQALQELGGWTNPLIVDWYADYARVVFENFGDRVKLWITMNEPHQICYQGYDSNEYAPMTNTSGYGNYLCAKHLVLAHAKAYRIYDQEFRSQQGGQCGITISIPMFKGLTEEHENAALLALDFTVGLYAHPIFYGDFPATVKERVSEKSSTQGYPRSRLPEFSAEDIELSRGTSDFFGINHYLSYFAYSNSSTRGIYNVPSQRDDMEVVYIKTEEDEVAGFSKTSLYDVIKYAHNYYNGPDIYVTENGWPTQPGLVDTMRVKVYKAQLNGVLDALDEGINVKGYTAWSLMDNFEWLLGYTTRYGLYDVDYESPERTRTPKKSAFVYKEIARSRTVDPDFDPAVGNMWIEEGH